jgi:hypothetical protein
MVSTSHFEQVTIISSRLKMVGLMISIICLQPAGRVSLVSIDFRSKILGSNYLTKSHHRIQNG